MLKAATFTIVLGLISSLAQAADCVAEDTEITLTGTIARETFPGPPNYESVANGDKAETYWILTSSEPVAICASKADKPGNATGRPQQRLQLVLDEKQYKLYAPLLNGRVSVKGPVFSAHTGHHHTEALVTVKNMQAGNVTASTGATCPAPLLDFLARFESDAAFRLEHTQFPLTLSYVDTTPAEPTPREKQISRDAFAANDWYPTKDIQTERRLERRITETSATAVEVRFDKPDSDAYTMEFQFAKAQGCWRLIRADDHSL
jgi:hypothetical protein